ncbi:hypothetical protein BDV93DRAFT_159130 [Ceratobasidium sp. AG-I]|nr:hypothetical protein BDV93DRAFT_159130 [Ceratobasidium sp. AG-I]
MAGLSMHIFRDQRQPDGPFDHDGERKQFVNALSSLTQFYTDSRTPTLPKTFISQTFVSPHEPEFTAYWHLFSLRRPPAMPELSHTDTNINGTFPHAVLSHPLFRLARTFITLWAQSEQLVTEAENMLISPKERAAREAREAMKGVHRFKRPTADEAATADGEGEGEEGENWCPQRFEYPPGFAFPALGLLRRLADPGVPWVLAAVLEASALDDIRARALWEVWQMRRGADILVSELVDLLGCDGPEDVRVLVDAVAEASGRAVRKLRPKGSEEIRAYRLMGCMKFPSHFPRTRRSTRLIDSKRPAHIELTHVVNQPWDQTTNGYELNVQDVPDLVLPPRVEIDDTDKLAPGKTSMPPPLLRNPSGSGLEASRGGTPFGAVGSGTSTGSSANGTGQANGTGSGGVFAGFGAVGKAPSLGGFGTVGGGAGKGNPFGGTGAAGTSNPFGGTTTGTSNPFGSANTTAASNPFGSGATGTTKANPFGGTISFGGPSSFGSSTGSSGNPLAVAPTPAANPFGGKPTIGFGFGSTGFGTAPTPTNTNTNGTSGFGTGSAAFGAGATAFGAGATAFGGGGSSAGFGAGAGAFGAGAGAFGAKPTKPVTETPKPPAEVPQENKPGSPSLTKLSPLAPSFVPKFGLSAAAPPPAQSVPAVSPPAPAPQPVQQDTSAAEAAKAAREARLRERLEAAKREEARLRAEEERQAEERRKQEETRKQYEEAKRQRVEAEQRRLEVERQRAEAERARIEAEHEQEEAERAHAEVEQRRRHRDQLHATTAQVLLADIIEILVVPEVQYAIKREKHNRWLVKNAFAWWKVRAAKRAKRRQVLENMGLGRVGVAGAAGEVGELFDEEDEEGGAGEVVVHERRRTRSLREDRSDADLAAAIAKATAERERLWAPGVFLNIITRTVEGLAREQDKSLADIPGWDVWLCTSGANKSSADWLRKKLNARPTQLVDGTVSVASVTPSAGKDSAPGLVVFECSPHLGAALTEQDWSDAWSNEADRIARLFSAMSNHYSYTPSLLFVVWSTDHVAQHSEAISRKIRKAASHLADVSVSGEPAVAVLVDETVETTFQEALASLNLDLEGRSLVEQSSITDSLSKQISSWHRILSHVLSRMPTFDDEDNAPHLAQIISVLLKAFNSITDGILRLSSPQSQPAIHLPDFPAHIIQDTKSLYNLADSYTSSLTFPETVDLNVLRAALRQSRHSGRPFPARFFCERVAQLVDIALTPLVSGNRPRSEVYAAEQAFEAALADGVSALDARTRKRVPDESPTRDTKKARIAPDELPQKSNGRGHVTSEATQPSAPPGETSGAAKLRALLDKTRNRWATDST